MTAQKTLDNILDEVMMTLSKYLTITDMLRLSEVNDVLHKISNHTGFEYILKTQMDIHRLPNKVPLQHVTSMKGVVQIFIPKVISGSVCLEKDSMTSHSTFLPCHISLQWNGFSCKAKSTLKPFIIQNLSYKSIFFPWTCINTWTISTKKNKTQITFNLVQNVYIQSIYLIKFIKLIIPENETEIITARILNRCNMLKMLMDGTFGIKHAPNLNNDNVKHIHNY